MPRPIAALALLLLCAAPTAAQEPYRRPPEAIVRILDAPLAPMATIDPNQRWLLLVERENLPPVRELARPMLRLAGHRINPITNGPFLTSRLTGLTVVRIANGESRPIPLPAGASLGVPSWSPDGNRFAFAMLGAQGVEGWIGDPESATARPLVRDRLNGLLGRVLDWLPDGRRLLCRFVPQDRGPAPVPPGAPTGPVVQESEGGRAAPVRTFQDLLKDPSDERLFEYYFSTQLALVDADTGARTDLAAPGIYEQIDSSPDGKYFLVSRLVPPWSYLVPSSSFPEVVEVWDGSGRVVRELARLPLRENVPIEGVPVGPRRHQWCDREGTARVLWLEALDDGDPRKKVPHRDRLRMLPAPFDGEPAEVARLEQRYTGLTWLEGTDQALLSEYDRDRRWARTWLIDPMASPGKPRLVWDRSVNDRYGDPGKPMTTGNPAGRSVARLRSGALFLSGQGATPQGDRPFLDRFDLATLKAERLWQCAGEAYEYVIDVLDEDGHRLMTRFETPAEPPNYFVRNLAVESKDYRLTSFPDPAPELRGLRKELVTYERADGVKLSATLYLPPGYKETERLPLIVWAYPREFNDAATAGQVTGSPWKFTRIEGVSHLFLLTQGYAIMDAAAMPVVGDPETANDTFLAQVVASAKACIDKAAAMGVADPARVGVGGHSYGAFMTANLLAHSDLFRAGVARSGAYNRTLTPFGFQAERRSLWEAPKAYVELSPFMTANRINEPLLLIHGELDDNPGTFPMQSERLFHAIKGNGGKARLVVLPYESHGYLARESVLHVVAEMIDWFDRYVKPAKPEPSDPPKER